MTVAEILAVPVPVTIFGLKKSSTQEFVQKQIRSMTRILQRFLHITQIMGLLKERINYMDIFRPLN